MTQPPDAAVELISPLTQRFRLTPEAVAKLAVLLERLADDPLAPTSIRDPQQIVGRHFADSLVALELEQVRQARLALDLGSGAGVPGLVLAAALPESTFILLESVGRKCAFLLRTAETCRIMNVEVLHRRAESYAEGHDRHDLVTARAVAALEVTAEYAAPLLGIGGTLVAWAGKRAAQAEAAAMEAARQLGLGAPEVRRVEPFRGAQNRHLYLMSKVRETPSSFPRRPGVAAKRPLAAAPKERRSSDRPTR